MSALTVLWHCRAVWSVILTLLEALWRTTDEGDVFPPRDQDEEGDADNAIGCTYPDRIGKRSAKPQKSTANCTPS